MTGPFSYKEDSTVQQSQKKKSSTDFDIPDRPRNVVMGMVMHQIDSTHHLVTAVVVDKYGEVMDHFTFSKLLEPRSLAMKDKPLPPGVKLTDDEELRRKKFELT